MILLVLFLAYVMSLQRFLSIFSDTTSRVKCSFQMVDLNHVTCATDAMGAWQLQKKIKLLKFFKKPSYKNFVKVL